MAMKFKSNYAFLPNFFEAIICISVSLIIMLIFYREAIYVKLTDFSSLPSSAINAEYQDQLSSLNHIAGLQTGFIAVFWAGLGVLVYLVYLTLRNVAVGVQNEVVITTSYKQTGSMRPRILRSLLQLLLGMALVGAALASATIALPFMIDAFGVIFDPHASIVSVLQAIAATLGLSTNLYVLWVMLQIAFNVA